MSSNFQTLKALAKELRENNIPREERREIITEENLSDKIRLILEYSSEMQEKISHAMGIGNAILWHLHEVMERDFQESEALLYALMDFFRIHGRIDLHIYKVKDGKIQALENEHDRQHLQDIDTFFSKHEDFINEQILIDTQEEESSGPIDGLWGKLCFKIEMSEKDKLILSFGDKDMSESSIQKLQTLFKTTWLLKRIREKLTHIRVRYTDPLTGLYNQAFIKNAIENNSPFSVIFFDLNKFKEYNDTYWHALWDELLKKTADILQSSVRWNDKVCRNGWDEFIIFVEGCDTQEIEEIWDRIEKKTAEFNNADNNSNKLPLSMTHGHAVWDGVHTLQELIDQGDKKMMKNKESQGDEWKLYRLIKALKSYPIDQQAFAMLALVNANPDLKEGMTELLVVLNSSFDDVKQGSTEIS